MVFKKARTRMKEAHRYGITSRKVHLNPISELAWLSRPSLAPRGWGAGCRREPLGHLSVCHPSGARRGGEARTCPWRCRGARREARTPGGRMRKGRGTKWGRGRLQAPGTQLLSYTRSLLVSTSTSVGGQGAAEAGTVIPSHLDCFGAAKARRDGLPGPSETRTSAWGSGVGSVTSLG